MCFCVGLFSVYAGAIRGQNQALDHLRAGIKDLKEFQAELSHCSQGILIYFVIIQNIIFHVLNNKDYVLNNKTLQSFKSSSSGHNWVVGRTWELLVQYSSEEIFILSFAYDHWVLSAQPPFYYLHRVADRFILFLKHSGQTVTLQIWIISKGLKEWWLFWLQTVRAKWPML